MNQENELDGVEDNTEELYEVRVIKTDKGQEPYRIDKFLMNRIEGATRNNFEKVFDAEIQAVSPADV